MRFAIATFFAILTAAFAAIEMEEGVMVLTDANFDEAVAQNDVLLVEFYAPWCGHCKSLAPEYAKAATQLADGPAKLAKLDATANKEQSEKHGIRGFPTLKFFRNGKVSDYNGGRTAGDIVNWMNKKSGPAATAVESHDQLESLKEKHEVFVLGVFDSADSAHAKGFMAVAADDDNLVYAFTTDADVKSKLGLTGENAVVLKTFDEKRNDLALTGAFDAQALTSFIAGNSVPLIQTFSQESAKGIFASAVKNHMLFFTDNTHEHHGPTIDTFSVIAGDYKGKALFINVPHTENRVLDYFGIAKDQLPALVLAQMGDSDMKKFPFTSELTADGIRTFMTDFFDGKLVPHLKSEEPQADDLTGDVVVLRGKSFNEIIMDNDKDALVEFYAPWCGHCKKLAPVFDEVGQRMKGNKNLVVAKMDSTANEINVPGVAVKGFPTLYFFKGNDKANPVKYEGGREADDFVNYLKKNAHHTVDHDEL